MAGKPTGSETTLQDEPREPGGLSSLLETLDKMAETVPTDPKVFIVHGRRGTGKSHFLIHELLSASGMEQEIDETLERLGVGINREIEKMDQLLSRLRRTDIAA
jgi:hypothetical protein